MQDVVSLPKCLTVQPIDVEDVSSASDWRWAECGFASVSDYLSHHASDRLRQSWWVVLGSERIGTLSTFQHRFLNQFAISLFIHNSHRGFGFGPEVAAHVGLAARLLGIEMLASVNVRNISSVHAFNKIARPSEVQVISPLSGERLVIFPLHETDWPCSNVRQPLAHLLGEGLGGLTFESRSASTPKR